MPYSPEYYFLHPSLSNNSIPNNLDSFNQALTDLWDFKENCLKSTDPESFLSDRLKVAELLVDYYWGNYALGGDQRYSLSPFVKKINESVRNTDHQWMRTRIPDGYLVPYDCKFDESIFLQGVYLNAVMSTDPSIKAKAYILLGLLNAPHYERSSSLTPGSTKDYRKAQECYLKAIEINDDAVAHYNLACLILSGHLIFVDTKKAIEHLVKSANKGYSHAYRTLAMMRKGGLPAERTPTLMVNVDGVESDWKAVNKDASIEYWLQFINIRTKNNYHIHPHTMDSTFPNSILWNIENVVICWDEEKIKTLIDKYKPEKTIEDILTNCLDIKIGMEDKISSIMQIISFKEVDATVLSLDAFSRKYHVYTLGLENIIKMSKAIIEMSIDIFNIESSHGILKVISIVERVEVILKTTLKDNPKYEVLKIISDIKQSLKAKKTASEMGFLDTIHASILRFSTTSIVDDPNIQELTTVKTTSTLRSGNPLDPQSIEAPGPS